MKAWRSPDVADPHGLDDPVAEEDEADPADEEFFQEQAGYDDCELGICPQPNMTKSETDQTRLLLGAKLIRQVASDIFNSKSGWRADARRIGY
uniref:Uncharacterized protein n=1 Tax=Oryza rufipogon TaxID=4529 RepID=A0A679BAH8_ORYRU|nr:hypothetical protein [Oryza rufipogon]